MRMSSAVWKAILIGGCIVAMSGLASAEESWLKGTPEQKFDKLAELQPGLGTIMIEYSYRFTNLYYAAKGGNWGFAEYNLQEMKEAQEVGENTRPKRAQALKDFEAKFLDGKLEPALKARDFSAFQTAFDEATKGCNQCHKDAHFGFIQYQLPATPLTPAVLTH